MQICRLTCSHCPTPAHLSRATRMRLLRVKYILYWNSEHEKSSFDIVLKITEALCFCGLPSKVLRIVSSIVSSKLESQQQSPAGAGLSWDSLPGRRQAAGSWARPLKAGTSQWPLAKYIFWKWMLTLWSRRDVFSVQDDFLLWDAATLAVS